MKKQLLFIVFFILRAVSFAQTPHYQWAAQFGGFTDDAALSVATDDQNNVYATGYFWGTIDVDPGPGVYNLTAAGTHDAYVIKLDPSGSLVWAKNLGGSDNDRGYDIKVDAAGNVYVVGLFQGTADFDPGPGVYNITATASYFNMFVVKLNGVGDFLWAKQLGEGLSISVTVGPDNNVYLAAANNMIKLDPSGNMLWSHAFGGNASNGDSTCAVSHIAVDATGNMYAIGGFGGTVDFDPGPASHIIKSDSLSDIFMVKIDATGKMVWAENIQGKGDDKGIWITLDKQGNIYTTGSYNDIADFDPGPGVITLTGYGAFVSKLDSNGAVAWAKAIGVGDAMGYSIALDATGNVYTTGFFGGEADFDPGAGVFNLEGFTYTGYISKLDPLGNFLWAGSLYSTLAGRSCSIAIDVTDNILVAGVYQGVIDLDPGVGVVNFPSAGSTDAYVVKINNPSPAQIPHGATNSLFTYPNPSKGSVTVRTPKGGVFILYNAYGTEVLRLPVSTGETKITLPATLKSGVYSGKLRAEDGTTQVTRIICQP